jgi:DNA replication and repair protein RecF
MGRMGAITYLKVQGLRNIRHGEMELPGAGNVLITGLNGAGKTSILEGIYLAARGRTFRSRKSGPVTTEGESGTHVEIAGVDQSGAPQTLSYRRVGSEVVRRWGKSELINGPDVGLRVRLIGENCQILLDGEPGLRRRFLDWNLFHVEPGYARVLERFRRAQWQRNAWITQGAPGPAVWDAILAESGEDLTNYRQSFMQEWSDAFGRIASACRVLPNLRLELRRGWPQGESLARALREGLGGDQSCGYTRAGPIRADFVVASEKGPLRPSRGQAKTVVAMLQIAADHVQKARGGRGSVWLIDDLESDLDEHALSSVRRLLHGTEEQLFLTRVADVPGTPVGRPDGFGSWFHVKQGMVARVS